jgi:hypothetical protein
VALGVRGQLKPGGAWITDKKQYDTLVAMQPRSTDPRYLGEISALMMPPEFATFIGGMTADDFGKLRVSPIRDLYGDKLLANSALIDLLATELGITTAVLVPQELPAGYLLTKIK